MKRVVFSLVLAVFCFWSTFAVAQTVKVFRKQGGTLGHISIGCGHPVTDWRELKNLNPELPNPTRLPNGMWDVRVFEGNSVFVPDSWDCSKLNSSLGVVAPNLLETETLVTPGETAWRIDPVNWLIALIVVYFLILLVLLIRQLRRRNRQFGNPIVPGGIRQDETQRIEERFLRIAERRYGEANPSADLSTERPTRISPIDSGFLNGHGRVQYRDRTVERRLRNEPGYRARFRFPDGTEQELYFLQVCANDVMAGTRYHGFTASRVVIPAPALVQQPAEPTVPAETPVPATSAAVSQNHQGFVTIRIFDDNGKILMEIDGENPSFEVERGPYGTKVSRRGQ